MGERRAIAAACVLALGLITTVALGGPAWRAWVGAAMFALWLPAGALGWRLTMRLAVGEWTGPLADASALIARRAAPAALLIVPVLVHPRLYPWADAPQQTAFRAIYFHPAFFAARGLTGIGLLAAGGWAAGPGRTIPKPGAIIGAVALFLGLTVLANDWLASLDPSFNASGFGLYLITIGFASALALAVLAGAPEETHRAGALLLALMLIWAYFAFMQYFILWSGNLPPGIGWYRARSTPVWSAALIMVSLCRLPVLGALLFKTVRHSRLWMQRLAGIVLIGSMIEFAWLALPGSRATAWHGALYAVLAVAGLTLAWPSRVRSPGGPA